MTEAQIQKLLKDYEQRLRLYAAEIRKGPQTFDGVEAAYEKAFQVGGVDVIKVVL